MMSSDVEMPVSDFGFVMCVVHVLYCVCNFVYYFECVCVLFCVLCIVVPLPPGTNPFAVNNINTR